MNYTEMLFNKDERLVNLLNQADSKNLELIEELNNREDEIERLNNIIKEAIEYLKENGWYCDDNGRIYGDLNDDECTELLDILNKGDD